MTDHEHEHDEEARRDNFLKAVLDPPTGSDLHIVREGMGNKKYRARMTFLAMAEVARDSHEIWLVAAVTNQAFFTHVEREEVMQHFRDTLAANHNPDDTTDYQN